MERIILCHRGFIRSKENTLESLTNIISDSRFKIGIEFDVQFLKDGNIVCFHDESLKRLYNENTILEDNEIKTFDKYDIPLLTSVLDYYRDKKEYILNIELKNYNLGLRYVLFCKSIFNLINKFDMLENIILSSFDNNIVKELTSYQNINTGLIVYQDYNLDDFKLLNCKYLIVNKEIFMHLIKTSEIDQINNKHIFVYTLFDTSKKEISEDQQLDYDILKVIKNRKNIGLITDDFIETKNFFNS